MASDIDSRGLKLYVVESKRRPLLGREWLRQLKFDWNAIFNDQQNTHVVSAIKHQQLQKQQITKRIEQLKQKYSTVFEASMDKIEGVQCPGSCAIAARCASSLRESTKTSVRAARFSRKRTRRIGTTRNNSESRLSQVGYTHRASAKAGK